MMIKKLIWLLCLATVFLAVTPSVSLACPICFGDPNSPMAQGANWAVFTLLGITGGVLSAFVGFIVHLIKRSKLALVQESKISNQSESRGRL